MLKEILTVMLGIALISIPLSLVFEDCGISTFVLSFLAINVPIDLLLIFIAIDGYRSTCDFYKYT
ncbi:MAG: hypothetical protein H0Z28_07155 [Archaeoglobus sp.]|nr:hypothetical protein [Archaeoglobus sp.]